MATIKIPDGASLYTNLQELPFNWDNIPASQAIKNRGDAFIKEGIYLGLWVPFLIALIVPENKNFLLNSAFCCGTSTHYCTETFSS